MADIDLKSAQSALLHNRVLTYTSIEIQCFYEERKKDFWYNKISDLFVWLIITGICIDIFA